MSKPNGHVLIVDDDVSILSLCRDVLEHEGFSIETRISADHVLNTLHEQTFDLILLDLQINDTHGMHVLEQIRAFDRDMPVVLVTGYATIEHAVQAARLGTQGLLIKPFAVSELRNVVSDVLQQRRAEYTSARVSTLRPLVQVSRRLLAELDLNRLYSLIVQTVCAEVHADRAALLLSQQGADTLHLAATIGEPVDIRLGESLVMSAEQLARHVVASREPLILNQEQHDAIKSYGGVYHKADTDVLPEPMGCDSLLMVPLLAGARVLGVVQAGRAPASLPFSEADQELLLLLAGQMTVAIENAQLYSLAQQRTERLDTLYRFSTSITASLDLNVITSTALQQLGAVLPLEQAHLLLIGGERPAPVQRRSWSQTQLTPLQSVPLPLPGSLVARVLSDGVLRTERRRIGIGTAHEALGVVLRSEQSMCGAIELVGRAGYQFSDEDRQFVIALAVPLALAIEKARLHAGIAASEERYRAVLEFANDAVLLLDPQGRRIIDANRSLEQLTGYNYSALQMMDPDALFDQPWHTLVVEHSHTDGQTRTAYQHDAGETLSTFETLLHTRSNVDVPVSVGVSRVPYAGEELLLLIVRDISERQRTAQQIVQAEKLAAVGRLAASIAHEVNNPLQAIYNSLHLLTKHTLSDDKRQRYLDMTFTEAERLISIVQRLLDFHRPSREGMRPMQVRDLLSTVFEQLADQLQQSQVELTCDWNEPLPRVLAIKSHLKHVFLNLLLNAVESMPTGGTLTVRVYRMGKAGASRVDSDGSIHLLQRIEPLRSDGLGMGDHLVVEISDTGHGIPPRDLHKIFEPFYTTKMTGTGLGLAISYNIVQQHGGELTATSRLGAGTTFRVSLPAAE